MSHSASPFPQAEPATRRRFHRYEISIPVDVVVLRSGIPDTIPGRSLDAGEGGVGLVIAGEVQPHETVGVAFQLPKVIAPVQAKAVVRHYGPLRCGLQFLAMSTEQQVALQTWIKMAADASGIASEIPPLVTPPEPLVPTAEPTVMPPSAKEDGRRQILLWIGSVLVVLAVAFGWWWHREWREVESDAPPTASAEGTQPLAYVPGTVMEQRLLHRVDPVYPPEAEKSKLQGLVVLVAAIGADGTVKDVRPLSGPALLVGAAAEAVRWWRFQPYQLNGQPVAVQTTIEVEFRLNQ